MKAVVISTFGGPEVLEVREIAIPKLMDNQVLVQVVAAGINRPDIFQRKGNYPAPPDSSWDIPGLEVSGYIDAVGCQVTHLKKGDRVMALLGGGGYAEYVAVDVGSCMIIPEELSFEEGAALPENMYTVWHNVFERGQLKAGDNFLVHGGAGGIGYTAIQLAKLFGAKVFTTVSTDEKVNLVRACGADHIVLYPEADFYEVWKDYEMDVILDSIGGNYFNKNIKLLKDDARLVYINAVQGAKVELNLMRLMKKRITLTGSTLRSRSLDFKRQLTEQINAHVMPLLIRGQFRVMIDRIFRFEEVVEAHRYMEANRNLGKIILKP